MQFPLLKLKQGAGPGFLEFCDCFRNRKKSVGHFVCEGETFGGGERVCLVVAFDAEFRVKDRRRFLSTKNGPQGDSDGRVQFVDVCFRCAAIHNESVVGLRTDESLVKTN